MNLEKFQHSSSNGLSLVLEKHQQHDQKTHGSWANMSVDGQIVEGKTITSLIDKLSEKKTPGFTIDIRTKKSPKDGFIASNVGAERVLDFAPLKGDRAALRSALKDYINDHAELLDDKGSFFGAWVEQGKLYLDVSRRYGSRSEGVRAGFKNEQKAIYDVVNDSYIYMKDEVDERTNKARLGGNSEASQGDDRAGEGRLRGRNLGSDRGQSVTYPHVCLGRYQVQKHRQGEHDQATHGNWAGDRYPADSVKSARDGAKEYAFKKGLKPDETIDYTKVVANRERASRIADVYETLPKMDRDAVDEYEALASEVEEQFDFMTKTLGVKVEFVADDPYKTSKEMFDDVSRGSLKVLQTETTGAHPLFSDSQNNKFRAVHDYFGHAATGRGFGQDGEEAAWVHHSQMFTRQARGALTTETRGQNSFFNNRGKQFADQKVALLPEEFWSVPAIFQKIKIIRFEPGLKPVFKHEQHDQSTHGSWADGSTGGNEGGNNLSLKEVVALHSDSDPLKQKIYDAEEVIREPSKNKLEKPSAPNWEDYDGIGVPNKGNRDDYDRAAKDYNKKWTAWAVEEQANILSDRGNTLLSGAPAGVKKYVEEVIKQDWFVEKFGNGKSLPPLDIKTGDIPVAGRHELGFVKSRMTGEIVRNVHSITIGRQFTKDEAVILHEISHYATSISQTKPFSGHGVEFAQNFVYVAGKAIRDSYASKLKEAYSSKGVKIGN